MVPNHSEWKQKLFKDLIRLDRGSSPRPIVDFITESNDGVNWIKIGDTDKDSLYINSTKQKITPEGAKKSRKVSKGEIILSNSMSYGQPYILNIDGYIHDGWFVLRDYEDNFDKSYLLQYLGSELIQNQYKRLAAGGVVSNISSELVYSVKANVPPLPEQQKIAKILTTWDKAINTTERLIENSKQQKKALMQQLLTGRKRLLDDSGQRFSGDWEEAKLEDLYSFKRGKGISKGQLTENGNKCVLYGELYTYYGEVINEVKSRTLETNSVKSKEGDVLIPASTTTTGIDLANATAVLENDILLGGDINILRPKKSVNPIFMAHLLTHFKKHEIARKAQGITIIHVYGRDLANITVRLPNNIEEQQKIVAVLTNADRELEVLEQQLADLQQEKKALMQQLLTGKKRVLVD